MLPVDDLARTATFYQDMLGFKLDFLMDDPPTHGSVTRCSVGIQFTTAPAGYDPRSYPGWTYIFIDNVDALHAEFADKGVAITQPLGSRDHGMREFEIEDLNGYRLRFGQYC
ncbi:MAG: VOC family protein [Betaproteobacteria bacterium]